MNSWDILLQQIINGLSLGAMYALLALGFTMVYGIIELINFAHFNIFMVGSFIAMWMMQLMGFTGQTHILYGLPLIGLLVLVLCVTMLSTGVLGALIERYALRALRGVSGTAPMITTIGISYILFNVILLTSGRRLEELLEPDAECPLGDRRGGAAPARGDALGPLDRADDRAPLLRAPHQDGQGDAGDSSGSGGGAHDGRRCRSGRDHHLLPRLGARGRRRLHLRALLQLYELHHRLHRRACAPSRPRCSAASAIFRAPCWAAC